MLTALPIYLAAGPAIGAEEVAALPEFTRPFDTEIELLQRERKFDHPEWLFSTVTWIVAVMTVALVWILSWGAARVNAAYFPRPDQRPLVACRRPRKKTETEASAPS